MARYIDADALKKQMHDAVYDYWNFGTGGYYLAEDAIQDIDNAPTADVQEVRHGRWIKPAGKLKIFENKYVICSECNVMLPIITEFDWFYYCPKCGAEMDGKE